VRIIFCALPYWSTRCCYQFKSCCQNLLFGLASHLLEVVLEFTDGACLSPPSLVYHSYHRWKFQSAISIVALPVRTENKKLSFVAYLR
jgi:hypothetical protein